MRLPRNDGLRMWRGAWLRAQHYSQDLFIAREILEQDDYRMRQLAWKPHTFIDIGAHCGYAAFLARRLWPACKIVCVEPVEENAAVCRINCPSAETLTAACAYGENAVRIAVKLSGEHTGGSHISESGDRSVPTVTLEELMLRASGDTLLKLDCEGGEFAVLENAAFDGIRAIVGESHGHARFMEVTKRRLPGWKVTVWRDAEVGLFKLERP